MINGKKVIIENERKKNFIVYNDIHPAFSAIHSKLCTDGMVLEEGLLYMLGNAYEFCIEDDELQLINSTFLNDLCGSLGIYLEEFLYTNEQTYFSEIKRNLAINIAPPMIHVHFDQKIYLSIVCKVYDDHSYKIISPVEKNVVKIDRNQIDYSKPWYMMNSPRFMCPVFRKSEEAIVNSIYKIAQKRKQLSGNGRSYFIYDRREIINKMAESKEVYDVKLRIMFAESIKYISSTPDVLEMMEKNKHSLEILWSKLNNEENIRNRYILAEKIFDLEEDMVGWILRLVNERKCWHDYR